jgi:hypothetical protein
MPRQPRPQGRRLSLPQFGQRFVTIFANPLWEIDVALAVTDQVKIHWWCHFLL